MDKNLLIIGAFILGACIQSAEGGSDGSGRAVFAIARDRDGDDCDPFGGTTELWSINGGDCDCPSGFTPVGFTSNGAVSVEETICLEE
tara:strand:+ start:272 stop:535 length:264 start_codon:yes stop_codon:yes gene_type:complete